jgi:hypothetical protein
MRILAVGLLAATAAHAAPTIYLGAHPVPQRAGGGFCYVEPRHSHDFAPDQGATLFRAHRGALIFVGDLDAFPYEGPRKTYSGPHPLRIDLLAGEQGDRPHEETCSLEGVHRHAFEPPRGADFVVEGGAFRGPAFRAQVPAPPPPPTVELQLPAPRFRVYAPATPVVAAPPVPAVTVEIGRRSGHKHRHQPGKCKHRRDRDDDDDDDDDDDHERRWRHHGLNRDDD